MLRMRSPHGAPEFLDSSIIPICLSFSRRSICLLNLSIIPRSRGTFFPAQEFKDWSVALFAELFTGIPFDDEMKKLGCSWGTWV